MNTCCPQFKWSLELNLPSCDGFDFDLGKCQSCNRNCLNIYSPHIETADHCRTVFVAPSFASDLKNLSDSALRKKYLRAWFSDGRLFPQLNYLEIADKKFIIETPLGRLTTECFVEEEALTEDNAGKAYAPAGNILKLLGWRAKNYEAEAMLAKPNLEVQHENKVTDCQAFVWRFRALADINKLTFQSRLLLENPLLGEIDSGEHLAAQNFSTKEWILNLGTQGSDKLYQLAETDEWLPSRFCALDQKWKSDLNFITYLSDGIAVTIPPIKSGEEVQIQFVAAWGPPNIEISATWFAVDLETKQIF